MNASSTSVKVVKHSGATPTILLLAIVNGGTSSLDKWYLQLWQIEYPSVNLLSVNVSYDALGDKTIVCSSSHASSSISCGKSSMLDCFHSSSLTLFH